MLNRKENLGTEVKNERIRRGMTQSEFASLIGISQSFLSRIESGARRNINLHTWELLSAQVPSLQSILDESKSFTSVIDLYLQGKEAYSEGDADRALIYLEQAHSGIGTVSFEGRYVSYLSALTVAGILRDQNILEGEMGAIHRYQQIEKDYDLTVEQLVQLHFLIAACNEMLGNIEIATEEYRRIQSVVQNRTDLVRVSSRLCAILTKQDLLAPAFHEIQTSIQIAPHLDDPAPYSFAYEKYAILQSKYGRHDVAIQSLKKARSEIRASHHLRKIQNRIAEISILLASGEDITQLASLCKTTLEKSEDMGFFHQANMLREMIHHGKMSENSPGDRS